MSPWNYPFILTLGPLISALAAGNSVILKPSEYTPHSSALMADMIEQLYDPREVTLVRGDKDAGQALLNQPFDHFFFTGSPAVGRIVMKAAAEHLSSVTLELGGKSPTVVDASANIEHAARTIVWGKFLNAGQTCIAPDYVLAERSILDDLLEAMRSALTESYGQTPSERQQSADYARIVNERHFERLRDALDEAIEHGARLEYGGTVDARERYIEPTVLTEVPNHATLMQEEIFGPIVPVQPFDHLDDAIAAINTRENPLALYHFTSDESATRRLLDHTLSGDVCVNDVIVHFMSPHLPFGGAGHSGIGASGGEYGFKEFSNQRSVLRRTGASGLMQQLYPPYGSVTKKLVDWLLPWA
jgi:aldehyde dehydrogenase (NAD+)